MPAIPEIPIEAEDPPEKTQEMSRFIPENSKEIQPAPKKRGRPAGAENKQKQNKRKETSRV